MSKHRAGPVAKGRLAKGLAVFAALLPGVAEPTARAVEVPPIPSPATVLSVSPFIVGMENELRGAVCQTSDTCTAVLYLPFVTPSGVTPLEDAIANTSSGKIVVFGYSNGAQVAQQWLTRHLNDPNAPSPEVLSFVLIGNPTRAFGGSPDAVNGVVWPASGYQVIDVAQQYDAAADYPNNTASPYYALAVFNAYAGFLSGPHLDYSNVDINDPSNAVWKVGNVTYVLTPTENLPILGGLATLFPSLNAQMKDQIETAYIRPVPFPMTTQTTSQPSSLNAASALSTSRVSDPAVSAQQTTVPLSLAATGTAPTTPPTSTKQLTKTPSANTFAAAVDTALTTSPTVGADVSGTVQAIPPAEKLGPGDLVKTKRSTTTLTARTATSTADGNKVAPDNADGSNGTVKAHRPSHGHLTPDNPPADESADPAPI